MMTPLVNSQPWMVDASCTTLTPDRADALFFHDGQVPAETIRLCQGCPVQDQCQDYAAVERIEYGTFGAEPASRRRERLGIVAA